MSTQTIESLEAARNAARETAANHPHQAPVEALTALIIKAKRGGAQKSAKAIVADAAKAGVTLPDGATYAQALSLLTSARASLQSTQHSDLSKAQAALTKARRAARDAADAKASEEFADLSIEALEAKRDELTVQRKGLKRKQRAVAVALSAKHEAAATQTLLESLSPEQRKQQQCRYRSGRASSWVVMRRGYTTISTASRSSTRSVFIPRVKARAP